MPFDSNLIPGIVVLLLATSGANGERSAAVAKYLHMLFLNYFRGRARGMGK